jgi:hypothetical protein
MNTNTTHTNADERKQPTSTNDTRRDDEQFWTDWWREYAKTWK